MELGCRGFFIGLRSVGCLRDACYRGRRERNSLGREQDQAKGT